MNTIETATLEPIAETQLGFAPSLAGAMLTDDEIDNIAGAGGSQTAGGGNTSLWGKIKSLMFGVDPSFYD